MKLIAYRSTTAGDASPTQMGVVFDDKVAPLTSLESFYADVSAWRAKAALLQEGSLPLADLTLAVPVPPTSKVICVAINYVLHGKEGGLPMPPFPNLFARWYSTLVPTGTPVPVPASEPDGIDWEVELAAIVGDTMTDASPERGLEGLLGYTVFNDLSGRASQLEAMTLSTGQWGLGKNLDNSGVIGSYIVTSDAVDADNLRLTTTLDGESMQDGTTADMVFTFGPLIEHISKTITLRPGDVIASGTPAGVGFGKKPRRYAKPGSVVEVNVHGVCAVTSPIVDNAYRQ
ncbi:fumarylacetoacetate hydrolase family protein [Variovorax humicola]|uniref:Fumarylacetoacetate hydrolase family protein n=1 Tax=Variovorax humicola TaxID=1769758 RepID=A0ABU8WAN9_9BURK